MSTIDDTPTAPKPGMDRRRFLAVSGLAAGAGTSTTAGGGAQGDLAIAMGAAGLEVLAVNTYGAALDAATAGDLGEVPPAVAEFATTAKMQHQAALDAWN